MEQYSDTYETILQISIGLGISILTGIIMELTTKIRKKAIIVAIGVFLIAVPLLKTLWPTPYMVEVPNINLLAVKKANHLLLEKRLVPVPIGIPSSNKNYLYVIENSQIPSPGEIVEQNTFVRYKAFTEEDHNSKMSANLFHPEQDDDLICVLEGGEIYRCPVTGTMHGMSNKERILLWVRPILPRSETAGWYLQRGQNGILEVNFENGFWEGVVQLGNEQWPPETGHVVELSVTIVDEAKAASLMSEQSIVVSVKPLGLTPPVIRKLRVRVPGVRLSMMP
jgi:hypothetical protein